MLFKVRSMMIIGHTSENYFVIYELIIALLQLHFNRFSQISHKLFCGVAI